MCFRIEETCQCTVHLPHLQPPLEYRLLGAAALCGVFTEGESLKPATGPGSEKRRQMCAEQWATGAQPLVRATQVPTDSHKRKHTSRTRHVQTTEFNSDLKRKEILPHATAWTNSEDVTSREISQKQIDKHCLISLREAPLLPRAVKCTEVGWWLPARGSGKGSY